MPDFAQHGQSVRTEVKAAFDPPNLIWIGRAYDGALFDQPLTRLGVPFETAFALKLLPQNIRQRLEEARVIARVFLHARRERTARPIRLLRSLLQFHSEESMDQ